MSRKVFLVLIIFLPIGMLTDAIASDEQSGDRKQRIFLRIRQAAAGVDTIESDFVQERRMSIMEKELISKGRFYLKKPNHLRWELLEPDRSGFIVNGGRGKKWRGQMDRQQVFELDQDPIIEFFVKQIFAWTNADFVWLEKLYHIIVIEDCPAVLKLVPNSTRGKIYLSHILLHFSHTERYVEKVQIYEENGDVTQIEFLNIIINDPIQGEDIFLIK